MDQPAVTGLALKLERVGVRVRQNRLADAMGVSPSRIAAIERDAVVTDFTATRYRAALEMCRTSRTVGEAVA